MFPWPCWLMSSGFSFVNVSCGVFTRNQALPYRDAIPAVPSRDRKTTNKLCHDTQDPSRVSNHPPNEYRSTALHLHHLVRVGRATAQAVSLWLPTATARFEPGSDHVGFMVDKVALEQVFYEHFGFPCQYSFHQLLHRQGLVQWASSGRSTKWTQSHPTNKNN
jgi:hypothetical protein